MMSKNSGPYWFIVFWPEELRYTTISQSQLVGMIRAAQPRSSESEVILEIGTKFKALWPNVKTPVHGIIKRGSKTKRFLDNIDVSTFGDIMAIKSKAQKPKQTAVVETQRKVHLKAETAQKKAKHRADQQAEQEVFDYLDENPFELSKSKPPECTLSPKPTQGSTTEVEEVCSCPACPYSKLDKAYKAISVAKAIFKDALATIDQADKALKIQRSTDSLRLEHSNEDEFVPPLVWPWELMGPGKVSLKAQGKCPGVFVREEVLIRLTALHKSKPIKLVKQLLEELFGLPVLRQLSYSKIPKKAYNAILNYVEENKDSTTKLDKVNKAITNFCYGPLRPNKKDFSITSQSEEESSDSQPDKKKPKIDLKKKALRTVPKDSSSPIGVSKDIPHGNREPIPKSDSLTATLTAKSNQSEEAPGMSSAATPRISTFQPWQQNPTVLTPPIQGFSGLEPIHYNESLNDANNINQLPYWHQQEHPPPAPASVYVNVNHSPTYSFGSSSDANFSFNFNQLDSSSDLLRMSLSDMGSLDVKGLENVQKIVNQKLQAVKVNQTM